ncbi:MAG: LytR/AlgR family response regulator transcription factor [Sediminibacterium sp.]
MIKTVIIEDEKYAAIYLEELLENIAPDVEVIGKIESVSDAIKILPRLNPDLILADIQLDDDVSFTIFEKLHWKKPIIFITAYDSYAIRAFKVNGVDYLLKPYDEEELKMALEKYRNNMLSHGFNLKDTIQLLSKKTNQEYKERFAIILGSRILSIPVQDIAYFFYANRVTYLVKSDGTKYPYTDSLDSIYHLLNPNHFFRVNRNYIIYHSAIEKIENHAGRSITITLNPISVEGTIAVSKDRITEFKYWLDK